MTAASLRPALRLVAAALILHLVLIQPNHPGAMTWGALLVFPLELPVILLVLLAFGRTSISVPLRVLLTLVLVVLFTLKGADFVSFSALSRGFNPVADLALIDAFIRLLAGSLGGFMATGAVIGVVALIACIAALIWWATGTWARCTISPARARLAGLLAILPATVGVGEIGQAMGQWQLPYTPPGSAFTARVGVERAALVHRTLVELRGFRAAADNDPFVGAANLFDTIDRDVLVIFVESYGRTSFDTPYYADLHRETLVRYEALLSGLGLSMQSGFLSSPTQGGQSWLAHATVANGLWINNQVSYAAALSSGRETLFHHAADAGFRTAALMPQITLDWPEADQMGFETVLVASDLGYRGQPFNWVTMPDQFSLAALDRLLRNGEDPRRLFAQVALVSSHAPWVPVPEILPWTEIGDGQVYDEVALSGDPPEVVWRDLDRVRAQYRLAIDYSLQAVFEYAALHADNPPLMIIIGDHQAAEFVALDPRAEVPIHIIGPAPLVAASSEAAPYLGLIPVDGSPVVPMNTLRDVLLRAFMAPPGTGLGN